MFLVTYADSTIYPFSANTGYLHKNACLSYLILYELVALQ